MGIAYTTLFITIITLTIWMFNVGAFIMGSLLKTENLTQLAELRRLAFLHGLLVALCTLIMLQEIFVLIDMKAVGEIKDNLELIRNSLRGFSLGAIIINAGIWGGYRKAILLKPYGFARRRNVAIAEAAIVIVLFVICMIIT
jgi:hypothetical protein